MTSRIFELVIKMTVDAARARLLEKIECQRNEMYSIYNTEPYNLKKLLDASRRLDKLIVLYQQQKTSEPVPETVVKPADMRTERAPGQPLQSDVNRYGPIFP